MDRNLEYREQVGIGFLYIAAQLEYGAQSRVPHYRGVQRVAIEVSGCDQDDEGTLNMT